MTGRPPCAGRDSRTNICPVGCFSDQPCRKELSRLDTQINLYPLKVNTVAQEVFGGNGTVPFSIRCDCGRISHCVGTTQLGWMCILLKNMHQISSIEIHLDYYFPSKLH